MSPQTITVPARQILTLTADAFAAGGSYWRIDPATAVAFSPVALAASAAVVLGPFGQNRVYAAATAAGGISLALGVKDDIQADANETGETKVANFSGFGANLKTIPAGYTATVGANSQAIVYGTFTITGTWVNAGETRIGAWPF